MRETLNGRALKTQILAKVAEKLPLTLSSTWSNSQLAPIVESPAENLHKTRNQLLDKTSKKPLAIFILYFFYFYVSYRMHRNFSTSEMVLQEYGLASRRCFLSQSVSTGKNSSSLGVQ